MLVLQGKSGGLGRNRTTDTRIFNPLLYQLSYQAEARQYSGFRPLATAAGRSKQAAALVAAEVDAQLLELAVHLQYQNFRD